MLVDSQWQPWICEQYEPSTIEYNVFNLDSFYLFLSPIETALLAVVILFFGMVEANTLQFEMDQPTEASGEQLNMFVHWYFGVWLGQFLSFTTSLCIEFGYLCLL